VSGVQPGDPSSRVITGMAQIDCFQDPKNSIMNIKMISPVFDVKHGWMQSIKENTNSMTFWENARIFSTKFFWTKGVHAIRMQEKCVST
jgi:hypothetical protein